MHDSRVTASTRYTRNARHFSSETSRSAHAGLDIKRDLTLLNIRSRM